VEFVRTDRQETVAADGGVVVMHVDTEVTYSLNSVGAWVWEELAAPVGIDRLVEGVIEHFEVSEETARADVEALVADLESSRLVSRAP